MYVFLLFNQMLIEFYSNNIFVGELIYKLIENIDKVQTNGTIQTIKIFYYYSVIEFFSKIVNK